MVYRRGVKERILDGLELLAQAIELFGEAWAHPWLFLRHVIIVPLLLPLLIRYPGFVISLLVWWLLGPAGHSAR